MSTAGKNYILSADAAAKKLQRMAYEILENNPEEKHLILAGIRENGYVVAQALAEILRRISDKSVELIGIKVDKSTHADIRLDSPVDFTGKVVILTDDVTNSGKTLAYALKPVLSFFPKTIQTLVMVERSHKRFPIHPDYVGLSLSTFLHEHIFVEVEGGRVMGAYVS
jgi:pyrimidine operon attenuation protein / uracil phosphoribosyltransferase